MAEPEKLLTVTVVTPDGIIYSHRAQAVAMRAIDGERTILYDHLPLVTPLTIGEVRVVRGEDMQNRTDHIAVNGGYIEFSDNVATIIADSAERARNIDVKRAQSAKERAEKHIQEAKAKHNEREVLEADIALRRAINRLNVRSKYGK
ncbi:F0F1 ATP synthase subunit epsilon [Lactobacillus hominis]|uniref:ATP synthase epsilon chain n=1 Tax=Lactobacillus hominis DSM 23910 = CRBIP 24.179 TaxID=1423758 RepID=I7LAY4_9LACO|nr:F0F1 ATP synthase subunit epsilon [Lactobacillus hominis]KRM86173.1 F0F1 ATP synthase subunit epsilon [Lactobacillus hominis DSM 23910 = CRBIP 24.179]MCT3348603.1 F0F1 ATP synthase subunit epsilon [Lactobacillus hominis]CCI82669.1 ATP synthase epsilon chain [Lactobacillus hominis DSM 23910 = CRBIP 24.179]